MALKDIIRKNLVTMPETGTIGEAAKLMNSNHVGAIIIVDEMNGVRKTPIGIVTDRDIVVSLAKKGKIDPKSPIKNIMTSNVVVCSPDDGIYETINLMKANGIRRIPVLNRQDHLVGIITSDDLLSLLGDEINSLSQVIQSGSDKEKNIAKPVKKGQQIKTSSRASA